MYITLGLIIAAVVVFMGMRGAAQVRRDTVAEISRKTVERRAVGRDEGTGAAAATAALAAKGDLPDGADGGDDGGAD